MGEMPMSAPGVIIGLVGATGSGKALASRRLVDTHSFTRIRFGDAIRDMVRAGFGLTDDEIDGKARGKPLRRLCWTTPGALIKSLSDSWGRSSINPELWAHEWRRRVDLHGGSIVVDDVRDYHDANAIRMVGGVIVRVDRADLPLHFLRAARRLINVDPRFVIENRGGTSISDQIDALVLNLQPKKAA